MFLRFVFPNIFASQIVGFGPQEPMVNFVLSVNSSSEVSDYLEARHPWKNYWFTVCFFWPWTWRFGYKKVRGWHLNQFFFKVKVKSENQLVKCVTLASARHWRSRKQRMRDVLRRHIWRRAWQRLRSKRARRRDGFRIGRKDTSLVHYHSIIPLKLTISPKNEGLKTVLPKKLV